MSEERFAGMTALVTGGGSGIGAATAVRLAAEGAKVCIAGRRASQLEAVQERLPSGRASIQTGDVAIEDDVREIVARAVELGGGKLDVVVNNAASSVPGTAESVALDDWNRTFEVNLKGALLMTRAALPYLRESSRASIVNVSSVAALVAPPASVAYATSKAALLTLTRQCALDFGRDQVRVNAVCPGCIRTEMSGAQMDSLASALGSDPESAFAAVTAHQPLPRPGEPAEVAAAISFLASPEASFVTGTVVAVDGGSAVTSPLAEFVTRVEQSLAGDQG